LQGIIAYLWRRVQGLAGEDMSLPTVRKLRRESGDANAGYVLLPPKNWLEAEEKAASKKILFFSFKAEGNGLTLEPVFENPKVEQPHNSTPEVVEMMMREGTLLGPLREIRKGKSVYRVVKVPRSWVRSEELMRGRVMVALRIMPEPNRLIVEPVFGKRLGR
jgi:hypothetical protein